MRREVITNQFQTIVELIKQIEIIKRIGRSMLKFQINKIKEKKKNHS